uniref:Tetratricopeptide repeat protein n=1 Tax=candidate division WOR-3 bacterium TaxID=2052148 RepID=A0A7C4UFF9_UNCW3
MKKLYPYIIIFFSISLISLLVFLPFSFKGKKEDTFLADSLFILSIKYFSLKDYHLSLKITRRLVDIQPDYGMNLFNLAFLYEIISEFDSAIIYYERCINVDPEIYAAYYRVGRLYLMKGDFNEGVSYLRSAIHLNPFFLDAYKELSKALFATGDIRGYKEINERIKSLENKR